MPLTTEQLNQATLDYIAEHGQSAALDAISSRAKCSFKFAQQIKNFVLQGHSLRPSYRNVLYKKLK